MSFSRVARCILSTSVAVLLSHAACAAVIDWNATGTSTAWATGGNWDGGIAPADSLTQDIARFNKTSYLFQPNAGTTSIAGIEIGDSGGTATAALTNGEPRPARCSSSRRSGVLSLQKPM